MSGGGYVWRIFREAHGLSLREAGALAGVSSSHLSRIERDTAAPSDELYERLVAFYATTTARRARSA